MVYLLLQKTPPAKSHCRIWLRNGSKFKVLRSALIEKNQCYEKGPNLRLTFAHFYAEFFVKNIAHPIKSPEYGGVKRIKQGKSRAHWYRI